MSILIDADTTFIVQGITGREAVNLTRECLDYGAGAKIVGGVTPGRLGREVHGVPVFDTVAQAVEHHGGPIDGSVVTVPPAFTKDAVFEAISNGIPAFKEPSSRNASTTLVIMVAGPIAGRLSDRIGPRGLIDATGAPGWVLMLPKVLGVILVLGALLMGGALLSGLAHRSFRLRSSLDSRRPWS